MQRIVSLVRTVFGNHIASRSSNTPCGALNIIQKSDNLLTPWTPVINSICNFKVKGRVRRRCKSCYFVTRDERMYVICPKYPRHKQMAMKPKPHNTWILTHASQSKVRPW